MKPQPLYSRLPREAFEAGCKVRVTGGKYEGQSGTVVKREGDFTRVMLVCGQRWIKNGDVRANG